MPPSLQMRKQSLVSGKSHLAGQKAEQGLNMGQEWGEGRGWRWPHSSQVWRLVQVWHMRSRTKLGTVRMVEKNQFDEWQSNRGSKTASQTQLWMKTKVGPEWFKNSNGLRNLTVTRVTIWKSCILNKVLSTQLLGHHPHKVENPWHY